MKTFLRKVKIIYQKLFFNSFDYAYSNRIKEFQDGSFFITFLRNNFLRLDDSNNISHQIEKNLLRSISFYSIDLMQLAHLVHSEVSYLLRKEKNYNPSFFSTPYLMIHLPFDESEEGTMHSDFEYTENGFYTCWVPISNYNYPPISTVNGFAQIISSFPKTNYLLSFFKKKDICNFSKPGDIHFWSHSFLHKGNKNQSNTTSFVLVTKLSKEPLNIGGFSIENIDNSFKERAINLKKIDYEYLLKVVKNLILDVNLNINLDNLKKIINLSDVILKNESHENLKIISFFCSIQAQRIWLRPQFFYKLKNFNSESPEKLGIILDVLSIIFGFENHSSFERLKKSNISFLPNYFEKHILDSLIKSELINIKHRDELINFFNRYSI